LFISPCFFCKFIFFLFLNFVELFKKNGR